MNQQSLSKLRKHALLVPTLAVITCPAMVPTALVPTAFAQNDYGTANSHENLDRDSEEPRGFTNPFSKLFSKKPDSHDTSTSQQQELDEPANSEDGTGPGGLIGSLTSGRSNRNSTQRSEQRASGGILVPLKSFTDKVLQRGRPQADPAANQTSPARRELGRGTGANASGSGTVGSGIPQVPADLNNEFADGEFVDSEYFDAAQRVSQEGYKEAYNQEAPQRNFKEPFQTPSSSAGRSTNRSPQQNDVPFFETNRSASASPRALPSRESSQSTAPTLDRLSESSAALPPISLPQLDDRVTSRRLSDDSSDIEANNQGVVKPITLNPAKTGESRTSTAPSLMDLSVDQPTARNTKPANTAPKPVSAPVPNNPNSNGTSGRTTTSSGAAKSNSAAGSHQSNVLDVASSRELNSGSSVDLPAPSKPAGDYISSGTTMARLPAPPQASRPEPTANAPAISAPAIPAPALPTASLPTASIPAPELPTPTSPAPTLPTLELGNADAEKASIQAPASLPMLSDLEPPKAPPVSPSPMTGSKPAGAPIDLRNSSKSSTDARAENLGSMQIPGVEVTVHGPDSLLVGQDTMFEVIARNQGATDLNGLLLRMTVPSSVNLGKTFATDGAAESEVDEHEKAIVWELPSLPAKTHKSLRITLTTEQPEHFAMSVEWTAIPQSQQYSIQVQQPRLELAIEGASEAIYGSPQNYRIRVKNPGNAIAKNVELTLEASTYGRNTSPIGDIAPGEEQTIEVELLFEKTGSVPILAKAVSAASNVQADSNIQVEVNHSSLTSTITGPSSFYQGSTAEFELVLSNSGSAAALDTQCSVQLPEGAIPVTIPDGAKHQGNSLVWNAGSIAQNQSISVPLSITFEQTGDNKVLFTATTTSGTKSEANHTTFVDAVTDLQLIVHDPAAPAPVGKDVYYDLEILNRGRKTATSVNVLVQFSEGVEPVRTEGQEARLVPGQVIYNTIPQIAPGERIKLRVVAEAATSGVHRFRVEVKSDNGEANLLQEASTRFLGK